MTYTVKIPMRFEITPVNPQGFAQAQQIFLEEMRAAVGDCVLHVQERVKGLILADNLVYTSHLVNSIAGAVGIDGLVVTGAVGTNISYAKYQEFGTVPHFVPFNLAPSLYEEMQRKWGWVKPSPRESKALKGPNPAAKQGPHGMSTIKGKRATYLTAHPDRLYLQHDRDSRPIWGVMVSGRKRPFMFPGWEQSIAFIEQRLRQGAQQAADRINGGGAS